MLLPPLVSQTLQYYATAPYPCSYLADQVARSQVATSDTAIDSATYSRLIEQGFRRSGTFIYRPHCDHCHACTSVRLPVDDFLPNRSQKRAWMQHANLEVRMMQPDYVEEHYALYSRYQAVRHTGSGMDQEGVDQYINFLVKSEVTSWLVEFRQPALGAAQGPLKMVSVIDRVHNGLSAVYTFYEPEPQQNLGTFNVLWQIRLAQSLRLPYLYLGYWIAQSRKMAYKTRFKPHELLLNGQWLGADFTK